MCTYKHPPNSHDRAENWLAVHGMLGVPRKAQFGQPLMEGSQYMFQVAPRFTICLG